MGLVLQLRPQSRPRQPAERLAGLLDGEAESSDRAWEREFELLIPPEEARHLIFGPRPGEAAGGVGCIVVAVTGPEPVSVLRRCREVLAVVIDHQAGVWPDVAGWQELLPSWFVEACPEESSEEADRWLEWWRSLPRDQQFEAERSRAWTLADWLYWLEPAERQWFWWDAKVEGDALHVIVELSGWPAPLGALEWLLRAAGASTVAFEENPPPCGEQ